MGDVGLNVWFPYKIVAYVNPRSRAKIIRDVKPELGLFECFLLMPTFGRVYAYAFSIAMFCGSMFEDILV